MKRLNSTFDLSKYRMHHKKSQCIERLKSNDRRTHFLDVATPKTFRYVYKILKILKKKYQLSLDKLVACLSRVCPRVFFYYYFPPLFYPVSAHCWWGSVSIADWSDSCLLPPPKAPKGPFCGGVCTYYVAVVCIICAFFFSLSFSLASSSSTPSYPPFYFILCFLQLQSRLASEWNPTSRAPYG